MGGTNAKEGIFLIGRNKTTLPENTRFTATYATNLR